MKSFKSLLVSSVFLLLAGSTLTAKEPTPATLPPGQNMYVIEREIPGAGQFTAEKLKEISQTSCGVLKEMGPQKILWLHSYVTGDKIYCVYVATSEEAVREHAKKGGFPANSVSKVTTIISPATAK
jgi:hypothetical protein